MISDSEHDEIQNSRNQTENVDQNSEETRFCFLFACNLFIDETFGLFRTFKLCIVSVLRHNGRIEVTRCHSIIVIRNVSIEDSLVVRMEKHCFVE